MNTPAPLSRTGLAHALLACALWGVMPVYFKLLQSVPSLEIVAHRIIWSVPLLLVIVWLRKSFPALRDILRNRRTRLFLLLSSGLIAANWSIYVWAVNSDHIVAASLGYFVSPLLTVFLGMVALKEKFTRNQWIAVAIAALGVSILAIEAWQTLWVSMALAGSWGLYSLIRKIAPAGPMVGLTVETGLLFPIALGYFLWLTASPVGTGFGQDWTVDALLAGGAIMTAVPLLLFASAVQKVPLTILGPLQYVAPSLQFLIAVFVYNEPLTTSHMICFGLIWISLAIFSLETFWGAASKKPATT
ncbi:MAG: EamA family transporter RarD [Parasphingorhabdus sp.]